MGKQLTTKEKIGRAAIALMAERGPDGVSMREIATVVGVSEAALYRHFANKNELIWEVFATHYDAFAGSLSEIERQHDSFEDKLTAMIAACCEFFDRDCDLFVFLLIAQHIQRFAPKDYTAALPALLHQTLAAAIVTGEVPECDVKVNAAMIMGCVIQTSLYCLYSKPEMKQMTPLARDISGACWRIVKGV
jgi:AcrR family transcriptional regulator